MQQPEHQPRTGERLPNIGEAGERAAENLKSRFEHRGEHSPDRGEELQSARKETEAAFSKESGSETKRGGEPSHAPRAVAKVTKKQKAVQYKKTLKQTQSHMSAPSRNFSKVIHAPGIEKASDALGSTVARPNAILYGGLTSFIVVGVVYIVAKRYGYPLSGAETMVAFGFGWALGLLIDYARLVLPSRR